MSNMDDWVMRKDAYDACTHDECLDSDTVVAIQHNIRLLKGTPREMLATEFVVESQRLCEYYHDKGCVGCPIGKPCHLPLLEDLRIVKEWAKKHPQRKRKTYLEDFMLKFPNTKIYKEENRPWFCRKEIYEGKGGYCPGYARGDCLACWTEEMEDDNE